jgi:hypothetical protein
MRTFFKNPKNYIYRQFDGQTDTWMNNSRDEFVRSTSVRSKRHGYQGVWEGYQFNEAYKWERRVKERREEDERTKGIK